MPGIASRPKLFPWISYRREEFGGFLFNPYLQRELALDPVEARTVESCDGRTPAGLLAVDLARCFRTDRATAERRLEDALGKLAGYFALDWSASSASASGLAGGETSPPRREAPPDCGQGAPRARLSAPLSILWEVTHACNLGCLHCLSAGGRRLPDELSTAEGRRLIDEMAAIRVFSMTIGGGEPLTRPDLFELIEHATARNLGVRLSTNGYHVDDEVIRRLADQNVFTVQVSVDGLRRTHDRFRRLDGAFDRAVRALRLFADAGYYTFMTVTATTLNHEEVPELVELALDLGVGTFKIGPAVPLGRALDNRQAVHLSPAELRELAARLRALESQAGEELDFQIDGLFPWLFDVPPAPDACGEQCGLGCSAGTSQVTVAANGDVYPCPYIRSKSAGSLRRASLLDIWRNEEFFAPLRQFDAGRLEGKCRDCAYRPELCQGGCRGAALAVHGDLYAEDPNCWLGLGT